MNALDGAATGIIAATTISPSVGMMALGKAPSVPALPCRVAWWRAVEGRTLSNVGVASSLLETGSA